MEQQRPKNEANQYPKIDRSKVERIFKKTVEDDALDIGWGEGVLDDGRPYWVEDWCLDQHSFLTFFISIKGIETDTEDDLIELFSKNGLFRFKEGKKSSTSRRFIDPVGNEFWSLSVTVGNEDEVYAVLGPPIYRYKRTKAED